MTGARALSRLMLASFCLMQWQAAGAYAGPPSPANPWTKRDYVDFYFSHWNGNLALPHLRNDQSRVLFDRIVDPQNVALITASEASGEEKQRQITMVLSTMGEIRASYAYAVLVGEPLSEELARVQAFTLVVLDAAIRLSAGTIDPSRKKAWRTTFFGIADSLADHGRYSTAQIAALSTALATHYPEISGILAQGDRRAFRDRVGRLLAAEQDSDARAAYARLLEVSAEYETR
jgi:hypothetical protein